MMILINNEKKAIIFPNKLALARYIEKATEEELNKMVAISISELDISRITE